MNRAEKLKKLGVETVKLIKEFREEACMLGENPLEDVYLDETNDIVIIENASKEIVEYSLSEISYIFADGLDGFNSCGNKFNEGLDLAMSEAEYEYDRLTKSDFANYIGSIIYAQYRCEEIYRRIIEIEKETRSL